MPSTSTPTKTASASGASGDIASRPDIAVSTALAQAGYIFSMNRNDSLGIYWELLFRLEAEKTFSVEVQSHGDMLLLLANPETGKPGPNMHALLNLSGRVSSARVGLNSRGDVVVLADLHRESLSSSSLKHSFGLVLETIEKVREIVSKRKPAAGKK